MTTEALLGWRKLFLILTVIPCCLSIKVSIPKQEYEVARGGDITMTCNFEPAQPISKVFVLTWEAYPDVLGEPLRTLATYFLNIEPNYGPEYEGRAQLEVDINRKVSTLTLKKVTIGDSRHYQCGVLIPNDDQGTLSATTSLLVLVPPSTPICTLQGSPEYFHNITLTCRSEEGSPDPVYEWKSYSVENNARPLPPKKIINGGELSLFNISRETSGYYICTATNRIGSASYNYTLAVTPGSMMNISSTTIIVIVVVAAVVLLGIMIFCCCRRKGKHPKDPSEEMEDYGHETGKEYRDDESIPEKKQVNQNTVDLPPDTYGTEGARRKLDDDQYSYNSGKGRPDGNSSDVGSQRYRDDQGDRYRGSRDRLDDQRDRYGGSRDRLDDQRDRYGGSRDRLDEQRDRYGGSRDRLDDQRDRYGGSRDRLDDQRDRYGGSRDRLDDQRDRHGSRDHLVDQRDRYGGSRDRLDDQRHRYGSRDRLDYERDHDGGRYDDDGLLKV
ncbi:cell surface A33 antigen-like isoform X2 [Mugil cephalus]|uniref:cell surface A33 antigen-like isoform X2 n=1 Tax=Mugil cephalus TaxID=48193 RepID=UPI001FB80AA1|nr:cell surface A33 antigen-like isoform X2 [Mugil cephalus]